jgi:hypothetical protein
MVQQLNLNLPTFLMTTGNQGYIQFSNFYIAFLYYEIIQIRFLNFYL